MWVGVWDSPYRQRESCYHHLNGKHPFFMHMILHASLHPSCSDTSIQDISTLLYSEHTLVSNTSKTSGSNTP